MGTASDTYANLIRAQYADYKSRYLPEQEKLMSLATDNSLMNAQLDRTSEDAQNAINTANQEQSNQMARMGVATQTNANNNSSSLSSALALASAKNGTRSAAEERNMSILAGDSARSYTTNQSSSSNA